MKTCVYLKIFYFSVQFKRTNFVWFKNARYSSIYRKIYLLWLHPVSRVRPCCTPKMEKRSKSGFWGDYNWQKQIQYIEIFDWHAFLRSQILLAKMSLSWCDFTIANSRNGHWLSHAGDPNTPLRTGFFRRIYVIRPQLPKILRWWRYATGCTSLYISVNQHALRLKISKTSYVRSEKTIKISTLIV